MAIPDLAWAKREEQQLAPGYDPKTGRWDPFFHKGPKWGVQGKLLEILGQWLGGGGAGGAGGFGGAGGQGFRFLNPSGQPYGGVFPGGYQTGIQGRPAWGEPWRGAAQQRLTGGDVGPLAGLTGGQSRAMAEGVMGQGAEAFGLLDREATGADRALQFATESAQARAGLGGQRLSNMLRGLGQRGDRGFLSMLLPMFNFG